MNGPTDKTKSSKAFTLIELMVVIFVILMLATMVMPTYNRVLLAGYLARSTAAIKDWSNGAGAYQLEHSHFPGQNTAQWNSGTSGSEMLYYCMFYKDLYNASGGFAPSGNPESIFMSYDEDQLKGLAPSDRFPEKDKKTLLYWPADYRATNNGTNSYRWSDNTSLLSGNDASGQTQWEDMAQRPNGKFYNQDSFLLISPGIDRAYFRDENGDDAWNDNMTNFNRQLD